MAYIITKLKFIFTYLSFLVHINLECFATIWPNFIDRFEKLKIPRLNIEQKYSTIFVQYGGEVEDMRKVRKETTVKKNVEKNAENSNGSIGL